jgi:hypothetical protein
MVSIPRAIRLPACVDPGERPVEAFDLVDQNHRLVIGAARALGGDDEVGLVRIRFHNPWLSQQRMNAALARADANEEARRSLRRPKGRTMLETMLKPPQGFGRGRRPVVELEFAVGAAGAAGERVHCHVFERV